MFYATTIIIPNPQLGLKWWYGIIAIINGALLILAYFYLYETKFDRPSDAEREYSYRHYSLNSTNSRTVGEVHLKFNERGEVDRAGRREEIFRVTTAQNHVIDEATWGPRTWKHSTKLINSKPDWWATVKFYKETGQGLLIPTLFWLLCLNGAYLGVYVYHASTFAQILAQPPYLFKNQWLGLVQLSQVVAASAIVPILGYGSDFVVKTMSRKHRGVYEPEYRLIALALPVALMIIACVIYGRAAEEHWNWFAIVSTYHLGFFAFNGSNMVGITYLVDSVSLEYLPPECCALLTRLSVPKQSWSPAPPSLCWTRLHLLWTELLHSACSPNSWLQDLDGHLCHRDGRLGWFGNPCVLLWQEDPRDDHSLRLEADLDEEDRDTQGSPSQPYISSNSARKACSYYIQFEPR